METLPDFISRELRARGDTVTVFADRIGVSRQTVARWNTSLPGADTLRRVASDLEVPYSQVLSAALASAGYIDSLGDMLAGQPLRVVTTCEGPYMERGEVTVAGVFSDPTRAEEYARIAKATTAETDVGDVTVLVDGAEFPDTMLIYTTTWWSRTDQIGQTTSICSADEPPARLANRDVSDVEASEQADSGQVFALRVDSLTPEGGRNRLTAVLDELRRTGRLLSPEIDPYEGWSGLAGTSWLAQMMPVVKAAEHAPDVDRFAPPQPEKLSADGVPAANTAAESVPTTPTFADLAATRESLESFLKRGFVWGDQKRRPMPNIRRFVVVDLDKPPGD